MYSSIEDFLGKVKHKDPNELEFHQAVYEVIESLWGFLDSNKNYLHSNIRLSEWGVLGRVNKLTAEF